MKNNIFEVIKNFFKKIFGKEEVLKLEEPKLIKEANSNNIFKEGLEKSTKDRMRLLNLQKDFRNGKIKQENINRSDLIKLKEIYCDQIIEISNLIEYYMKKLKV